jgi:hypothetical protein
LAQQMRYGEIYFKPQLFSDMENLVVVEIGEDVINSASGFVNYIVGEYSVTKSSVWNALNSLKERGIVDFADQGHQGKPLVLTALGGRLLILLETEERKTREYLKGRIN